MYLELGERELMPRRKRKVESESKTALELAMEELPSAVDDAAMAMMESAATKPKRKRQSTKTKKNSPLPKIDVERNPLLQDFVRYTPPKLKFSRKRIRYKEGDLVEIVTGDETFTGTLIAILSTQLVVRDDNDREKFFFTSGLNIKRLKRS